MAVINDYVDSNLSAGKKASGGAFGDASGQLLVGLCTFEVAAADSDGSIYRVFKNLDPNLIPARFYVYNDAITGGTSFSLGLYESLERGGAAVSASLFMSAVDFSSAHARGSALDGLSAVDIADAAKRLYELAGHTLTTKKQGYDLAFTATTVGSAAGTITIIAFFIQG